MSVWLAQQGRKKRLDTFTYGLRPWRVSSWKVRVVNGLPIWIKNPMKYWKTPDDKSPLDQDAHVST